MEYLKCTGGCVDMLVRLNRVLCKIDQECAPGNRESI